MRIDDFELERFFARYEFCRAPPPVRLGRRGLADGRAPRARRRRDARAVDGPDARLHGVARATRCSAARSRALYDTIVPDEVLVFSGAEEAIFCAANVLLGPGDHAIVAWPAYQSLHEVARATGADVTLHELHASEGWAIDPDRLRAQVRPDDPAHRRQRPAQPDGDAARRDHVRGRGGDRGRGRRDPPLRRGLPLPRARPGGPPPRRCGRRPARRERRGDVEVVRARRAPDRVARDARRPAAGRRGTVQGLHDDHELGARGDPRAHRAACPGPRPRPFARDRGREPRPARRVPRPPGRAPRVGAAARRLDRLPGAAGPTSRSATFAENLLAAEGVLLAPGSVFGHPGNHFRIGFGRAGFAEGLERLEAFTRRTLG